MIFDDDGHDRVGDRSVRLMEIPKPESKFCSSSRMISRMLFLHKRGYNEIAIS